MTATYTTPERLALSFAGLLVAAVMAFGLVHVAPNRHLHPQNEIAGTLGLYWAAILLLAGVWLVARGRREMRWPETATEIANWNECFERRNRTLIAGLAKPRPLMYPDDGGLRQQVRAYKETFSAVPA